MLVTNRVTCYEKPFWFSTCGCRRQAAKPPSRQAAKPPSRQAAKPPSTPCWREQVYQLALANQPLTVKRFLPSSTRALTVSGRVINSPRGEQPIITARHAVNGNPVEAIKFVAESLAAPADGGKSATQQERRGGKILPDLRKQNFYAYV
jgi:hypothetical protein